MRILWFFRLKWREWKRDAIMYAIFANDIPGNRAMPLMRGAFTEAVQSVLEAERKMKQTKCLPLLRWLMKCRLQEYIIREANMREMIDSGLVEPMGIGDFCRFYMKYELTKRRIAAYRRKLGVKE